MIRLVSFALGKIWGKNEEDEDKEEASTDQDGNKSADGASSARHDFIPGKGTHQTNVTEPSSDASSDQHDQWQFTGHVTSLHDGYGLIDQQVYFSFKIARSVPPVGAKVDVKAHRIGQDGGWRADSVRLFENDWDETTHGDSPSFSSVAKDNSNMEPGQNEMIAVITSIAEDGGYLNDTFSFSKSCVKPGYMPGKGDWVVAEIEVDKASGHKQVLSLHPLREYNFEGEVNSVKLDMGYINYDIYFTFDVCESGYKPQRGDYVCGQAVENGHRQCNWRAVKVVPLRKSILPSMSLPSPSQTKSLDDLLADKEGIDISSVLSFGSLHQGKTKSIIARIRNAGNKSQKYFGCQLCVKVDSQFSGGDILPEGDEKVVTMEPGSTIMVTFICNARNLGHDQQLVVFKFDGFKIGRHLTVEVADHLHQTTLDPSAPYQRQKNRSLYQKTQEARSDTWLVPGQRPARRRAFVRLPNRFPQYTVPRSLETVYLERGDISKVVPVILEELSMENYSRRFSALLHMEEMEQHIDIRQFDLERECMRSVGEYLAITVPGLSEGRPSVLVGDRVIASAPTHSEDEPEYEGFVHEVLNEEVLLKFSSDFHNKYMGEDFNFRFIFHRAPLRKCHQGANLAPNLGEEVLFPTKLIPKIPQTKVGQSARSQQVSGSLVKVSPGAGIRRPPLRKQTTSKVHQHEFFNDKLNLYQKAAVLRILSGQSRPTPYMVFGPPGTGKTVTIVEAMLQVLHNVPTSRIIACAPSNSAADLIAVRLHMSGRIKQSELARLNAFHRGKEAIPKLIQAYCHDTSECDVVVRHRIIVCTCQSTSNLYSLGFRPGHFTHVFIDEAGQATEPEAVIPMVLVAGTDGQIVLSGDPFQLGPVLRSSLALHYGLGLSLLERLMSRPLYLRDETKFADHGNYDPLLVTKLLENYRSHPVLLKVPSILFYQGELSVAADRSVTDCLCQWPVLPNQGVPIIFHGLRGEDMREGSSPSWFNPMEAVQVIKYLQAVVNNTAHPVSWDDIGIITPYRKQGEKIASLIIKLGMTRVKLASVEEFQGQERLVMILSTVRSSESQVNSDILHNLGFLSNPKRFNVAISRAQALLIIVGNPHILSQDPHWNVLIQYCVRNKAYVGCDLPLLDPTDLDLEIQTDSTGPTGSSVDIDSAEPDSAEPESVASDANLGEAGITNRGNPAKGQILMTEEHEEKGDETCKDGGETCKDGGETCKDGGETCKDGGETCKDGGETCKDGSETCKDVGETCKDGGEMESRKKRCVDETERDSDSEEGMETESDDSEDMVSADSVDTEIDVQLEKQKALSATGQPEQHSIMEPDQPDVTSALQTLRVDPKGSECGKDSSEIHGGDVNLPEQGTHEDIVGNSDFDKISTDVDRKHLSDSYKPKTGSDEVARASDNDVSLSCCHGDVCTEFDDSQNADARVATRAQSGSSNPDVLKSDTCNEQPNTKDIITDTGESDRELEATSSMTVIAAEDLHANLNLGAQEVTEESERARFAPSDPEGLNAPNAKRSGNATEAAGHVDSVDLIDATTEPKSRPGRTWTNDPANNCAKPLVAGNDTAVFEWMGREKGAVVRTAETRQKARLKSTPSLMESQIIRQIEYYFSDVNLSRDKFMMEQLEKNNGWVPVDVLTTFNRLKAMSTDHTFILSALSKSTSDVLKLDHEAHRVGRSDEHPIPADYDAWKKDLRERSVFVQGLKTDEPQDELEQFFTKWGSVEHIHKLKPLHRSLQARTGATYPLVVIFRQPFSASSLITAGRVTYKGMILATIYRSHICQMIYNDKPAIIGGPHQGGGGRGATWHKMDTRHQQRQQSGRPPGRPGSGGRRAAQRHSSTAASPGRTPTPLDQTRPVGSTGANMSRGQGLAGGRGRGRMLMLLGLQDPPAWPPEVSNHKQENSSNPHSHSRNHTDEGIRAAGGKVTTRTCKASVKTRRAKTVPRLGTENLGEVSLIQALDDPTVLKNISQPSSKQMTPSRKWVQEADNSKAVSSVTVAETSTHNCDAADVNANLADREDQSDDSMDATSNLYTSLEQRDSDVVVESSDEEF